MAVTGQYSTRSKNMNVARKEFKVTGNFGWRIHPVTGEPDDWHTGTDYGVANRTPLTSYFAGEVTGVHNRNTGYGGSVAVYNSDLDMTYIASHMRVPQVVVGQRVTATQSIGLSGGVKGDTNAGTSTGAHLHATLVRGRHSDVPSKNNKSIFINIEEYDASIGGGGGSVDPIPTQEVITIITKDTNIKKEFSMGKKYEVTSVKGDQIILTEIKESFKVGSKVQVKQSAKNWATGQSIPSWVKGRIYTVKQSNNVKTLLGDGINSWINNTDLTQV